MNDAGAGVREIRIRVLGEWRILYVAKFAEAVYVLLAFQKKAQKTRSVRKLPRQGDSGKGELLASSWARYMAGGRPANASWGRSSL